MTPTPFGERLAARVAQTGSALCVGLDPRGPFPEAVTRGLADSRSGHARAVERDRKSTRLNSRHVSESRMPSSA